MSFNLFNAVFYQIESHPIVPIRIVILEVLFAAGVKSTGALTELSAWMEWDLKPKVGGFRIKLSQNFVDNQKISKVVFATNGNTI